MAKNLDLSGTLDTWATRQRRAILVPSTLEVERASHRRIVSRAQPSCPDHERLWQAHDTYGP